MSLTKEDHVKLEVGEEAPVLQKRLLTFLLGKKVPAVPTEEERKPLPRPNILSQLTFLWVLPVLKVGYKRTLEPEDMFYLPEDLKVDYLSGRFHLYFEKRLAAARAKHIEKTNDVELKDFEMSKFLTLAALFDTFKLPYIWSCALLALAQLSQTLNPLIIRRLIKYVELKGLGIEQGVGKGVGLAIGCTLLILVNGIFMNQCIYKAMSVGIFVKSVLTKALLEKSFRLSARSKHDNPVGKITSIMGTDLSRIDFALGLQPFLIVFPVPFIVAIIVLCITIGPVALLGIGLMILFIIAISASMRKLFRYRKRATVFTDARVNYIKECLNNLRIIKYYSWEPPYFGNISSIRSKEMKIIYNMQVIRNTITAISMTMTSFCSMVTFLVLYAIGGSRDPANIFSSLSLFNVLTQVVFILPQALASGSDALVGITRVGNYLASEELGDDEESIEPLPEWKEYMERKDIAIKIDNATFEWEVFDEDPTEGPVTSAEEPNKEPSKDTQESSESHSVSTTITREKPEEEKQVETHEFPGLKDIDIEIKRGEFVVISGLIGSGKSSLLNAISGFMKRTEGSVNVDGSLILCGQPWIQNATVRDNIIFGDDFDEKKYADVIYSCSLESDLAILPAGDRTEIGERGITLSGGQKARINLARAVYADKDVILMDDVLSAVDARVGKHIVESCIMGLLNDRTRILATHQLSLISSADRIIFLNGDGSISIGTYEELQSSNEGFQKLMIFNQTTESAEQEEEEELIEDVFDEPKELEEEIQLKRTLTRIKSMKDEEEEHKEYNKDAEADGRLVLLENKGVNGIENIVFKRFLENGSGIFHPLLVVVALVLFTAVASFCLIFTSVWLSYWTENSFDISSGAYIGIYVMFTFLTFIFFWVEFVLIVYITNRASVNLNIKAAEKILYSKMSFMDTTPMGRILNRFTKDTDVLDNELGEQTRFFIFTFGNIIAVVILNICYLPWFAIAVPFLAAMFIGVGSYYLASAREVKRIEAVQRSFVYNNFNETLNGMATIKAYKAGYRFMQTNSMYLNRMNESGLITIANQRWLTINLTILAAAFAFIIALLCIFKVFNIKPSSTGLLLSYTLQMTGMFSLLIRNFTQVENNMTSVERITDFAYDLPSEAPYEIPETKPAQEWPQNGEIAFKDVSMAYRPGLPLVLKNLNAKIGSQEKIGICGRTGAGKSSIMTALYRLSELQGGEINIDGVDISKIGLKDLRSKLSIIPQDPVLFRGSIRRNLDPFGYSSDEKLWDSLRRAGLIDEYSIKAVANQSKDTEKLHKFHLDQMVEDDGTNFSLGERQLIAFARALVRDSKILILDEATSSVDYETDSKIQETIVREFGRCTILCIAHRLKTIINYDRILVLDKGEIKEFDTPWNLFNSKDSIFRQMCEKSAIVAEDFKRESF